MNITRTNRTVYLKQKVFFKNLSELCFDEILTIRRQKFWIWTKMESSWIGVFKFWLIVASFWNFVVYSIFGLPNETPVTLVIDIFKLSTSRQISLWGCTFGHKGFTQVAQVQISQDAGARPILTLIYQFWAHQF